MLQGIQNRLLETGFIESWVPWCSQILLLVLVGLISLLIHFLLRNLLLQLIHRATLKTTNAWDDALFEARVFHRLLRLVPLTLAAIWLERAAPSDFALVKRLLFAAIILVGARGIEAFLKAISTIYHRVKRAGCKPIRPLIQALAIGVHLFAAVFIIGVLLDKSPWKLVSLMGGLTAITMLVFKDTILGFVAGIQLGANDMVREGDWIEMPKYGADGDVIEVTVHTVKVRNWDKTITTIPTYALIADSFKNWRGMSESGGRRIKRSICIDMNTVRFVDAPHLASFRRMELLARYVDERQREIDAENTQRNIDLDATPVNGRRQTNLGLFRAYLVEYLRRNPKINQEMTFLVRQLQATPQGLPIEIYVFSSDKVWANYEAIQADIFDHVLAALPEFGLRVYQQPSGADVARGMNLLQEGAQGGCA